MSEQNKTLLEKLEGIDENYCDIEKKINDPEIASDPNKIIPLTKEQAKLKPIIAKYRNYLKVEQEIEDAETMLEDEDTSEEFKEMATEELSDLNEQKETLLEEVKDILVMADDASVDSIIMEIRAGTGGDEAAIFARDLYNMYSHYAERKRWKVEVLDFSATERNGFKEIIFSIKGGGVWADLGYEGGGHRVQRVPETESQGRIHTSAATVAVLPEAEDIDIEIDPNDVLEHVSRAGGPGGQAVNKINSAIRLEHVPTGITVSMRDEKSQHKNRSKAWRILRSRIYEHFEKQKQKERDSARKGMIGTGDRSSKIRTYNFPQNRVTDHRINFTSYNLDKFLAGDLEEMINALREHDKLERLKNL